MDLFNQPMYQAAFANKSANFPQSLLFSHLSITGQLEAGETNHLKHINSLWPHTTRACWLPLDH